MTLTTSVFATVSTNLSTTVDFNYLADPYNYKDRAQFLNNSGDGFNLDNMEIWNQGEVFVRGIYNYYYFANNYQVLGYLINSAMIIDEPVNYLYLIKDNITHYSWNNIKHERIFYLTNNLYTTATTNVPVYVYKAEGTTGNISNITFINKGVGNVVKETQYNSTFTYLDYNSFQLY